MAKLAAAIRVVLAKKLCTGVQSHSQGTGSQLHSLPVIPLQRRATAYALHLLASWRRWIKRYPWRISDGGRARLANARARRRLQTSTGIGSESCLGLKEPVQTHAADTHSLAEAKLARASEIKNSEVGNRWGRSSFVYRARMNGDASFSSWRRVPSPIYI
ncbi:hypothetical protein SKAU_G00204300 [Synaphobranchus kaupii]|uniref:Uncharacterized protein n=1 Tax=Synaphobranchus kaupii TaxID=118154 RepID=A0A9Q1FG77_SYNKA|nr:hypothetical protein SKAU_G00204300 [Synaphobranchus kaupii]